MSDAEGVDILDVSGMYGIRARSVVSDKEGPLWEDDQQYPLPGEIMSKLKDLIGDGDSTVTVGVEAKSSPVSFHSVGATVFVKLTCDQTEEAMDATGEVATDLAGEFLVKAHQRAAEVLGQVMGGESADKIVEPSELRSSESGPRKAKAGKKKKRKRSLGGQPSFRR